MSKIRFVSLFVLLTLLLSALPGVVVAQGPLPPGDRVVPQVLFRSEQGALYAFGGRVEDKEAAVRALESYIAADVAKSAPRVSTLGYSYSLSKYYQVAYGDSHVYAEYNSDLDMDLPAGLATRVKVSSGTSRTAWLGSSPQFKSTEVKLEDEWTWHAIGGVSISTGGGGISVSGHSAYWSGGARNTWYLNHRYGGMTGKGALIKFSESSTGSHYFESTYMWVSATAYNDMWV